MRVLARGYTLTTTQDGQPADLKKLQPGDRLVTRFADGTAESRPRPAAVRQDKIRVRLRKGNSLWLQRKIRHLNRR